MLNKMPIPELHQVKAKRVDNGEWVVGLYFIEFFTHDEFIHQIQALKKINGVHILREYEIDPTTLCRCSGLNDKNGKLIYEGDIVKSSLTGSVCKVFFSEVKLQWSLVPWTHFSKEGARPMVNNEQFYEIIGNIHTNPELLEGGAE